MFDYIKVERAEREKHFLEKMLPLLRDEVEVKENKNGSYRFFLDEGVFDFYPKGDRILELSKNKWYWSGLKRIIAKIEKQNR